MLKSLIHKYAGIIVITFGVVALVVLLAVMAAQFVKKDDSPATQLSSSKVEGAIVCLSHKDTSGPQTMECAFGLKDIKGKQYSLKDTSSNYANLQSLSMGKKVRVSGTIGANLDTRYDTVGTIEVRSIDEL